MATSGLSLDFTPLDDSWDGLFGLWSTSYEFRYYAVQETPTGASTAMATTISSIPYRLIYELGNAFACQLDLDPLLELVTQKCREVLEAEGAAILLLDPRREELYAPVGPPYLG